MSIRTYEFYKNKFNNTKPIRGRDVEVRPIGQRRRDWEKVTRKDLGDGTFAYCAKLYDTECVEYHPNGDIVLRVNGWQTPSTAEFIHTHSPFTCFKKNRKLWVKMQVHEEVKVYPLSNEPMRFKWNGAHGYEPAQPIVIKKQVVNRSKAKAAREPVMPFVEWARVFINMSDGWLMHETQKQVFGWGENGYIHKDSRSPKETFAKLVEALDSDTPEETYMWALCRWADAFQSEFRVADIKEHPTTWQGRPFVYKTAYYDYMIDFVKLKRKVYKWVEDYAGGVHDTIEVAPSNKTMTNVV